MGQDGSQSPDRLLPDRTNRSDRTPARETSTIIGNRSVSFSNNNNQALQPQPQASSWFGSMSPIRRTSPPSTSVAGSTTADGIPLYPCLSMRYNCHHDNHCNTNRDNLNNNTNLSGIMALSNFQGFGGSSSNTPPPSRKFTFNFRSPQIAPNPTMPMDAGMNALRAPSGCPGAQTPPGQQFLELYNYSRKLRWLIPIVVMVDSLVLLITMYENDCPGHLSPTTTPTRQCVLRFLGRLSFQPLNENPMLGPSYQTLLSVGALNSKLITKAGQGWRLLTAVWLHAGVFHLVANMLSLCAIGRSIEKKFGWIKLAVIYMVAGFGGSLLSALFMQNQISVGASGAVMGLLGATVAEMLVNWSPGDAADNQNRNKTLVALLLMLTVNLSFGLMPHVDNFAHIGGLCAGALLGFILLMRPRSAPWMSQSWIIGRGGLPVGEVPIGSGPKHTRLQNTARFIALGLLVFSYAVGMLALFKGYGWSARRTCRWCKYMSCVPSVLWQCQDSSV